MSVRRRFLGVRFTSPALALPRTPVRTFSASLRNHKFLDVRGKTAIITGAGSGINLSFAKLLTSKSCSVIIADLKLTSDAEAFVAGPQPAGATVVFKPTDVASYPALASLFEEAGGKGVSIVVPGAAVYEPGWSSFFGGDEALARESRYKSLDINLTHPISLTRLAISHFLRTRQSRAAVVCVSSVSGQCTRFATPLYVAAKHGVHGFVRSVGPRLEQNFGIRVAAVAPGVVRTPLWTEGSSGRRRMFVDGVDQWVSPEEVAEAMLTLVEGEGDCVKGGTVMEVGKGQTRVVGQFNDPGPSGKGFSLTNGDVLDFEAIELLKKEEEGGGDT